LRTSATFGLVTSVALVACGRARDSRPQEPPQTGAATLDSFPRNLDGSYARAAPVVARADLDGDGHPEMITAAWDTTHIPWRATLAISGATINLRVSSPADPPASVPVLAVDLNGDGIRDLVLAAGDESGVSTEVLLVFRDSLRWARATDPRSLYLIWGVTEYPRACDDSLMPRIASDRAGVLLSVAADSLDGPRDCSRVPRRKFRVSGTTLMPVP
jgi:hypothetical protein